MEIIVVLIILAILTITSIPIYTNYIQQGAAKAAQNNLMSIYNAQKMYAFSNGGNFCLSGPADNFCAGHDTDTNSLSTINSSLNLNITDNYFNYKCALGTPSIDGGFKCTATNIADSNFVLTVRNQSVVLPGSSSCPSYPWDYLPSNVPPQLCNPACVDPDNNVYCPTN